MITKEFLQIEYIDCEKSSEQIGHEVGLSGRQIRNYLKKLGFESAMQQRRQTASLGKEPSNKGKIRTASPALGRYYVNVKGKSVPRARVVAAQALGRPLRRGEIVHHKDEDSLNDSPDNLEVITQGQHIKIHQPHKARWGG